MGAVKISKGSLVVILVTGLVWANLAWALPATYVNGDNENLFRDEFPDIECDPLIYNEIMNEEILTGIFDIAAAETWTCPKCTNVNPVSSNYCSECGNKKPAGTGTGGTIDLSKVRICPKCGIVNDREVKFCGECGYAFGEAGGVVGASVGRGNMVYVPEMGWVPKGTMIEKPHRRTGLWVSGLLIWLVGAPVVSIVFWPVGIAVGITGFVLFIVGLATKTKGKYALLKDFEEDDGMNIALRREEINQPASLRVDFLGLSF